MLGPPQFAFYGKSTAQWCGLHAWVILVWFIFVEMVECPFQRTITSRPIPWNGTALSRMAVKSLSALLKMGRSWKRLSCTQSFSKRGERLWNAKPHWWPCHIELHWTIGVTFCCTCCGLALTKCVEGERGRAPELGFTRSLGDLMQLGRNKNPNAQQIDLLTDPSRYKSYGVIAEPEIFKLEKAIVGSILHRLELWKFGAFFFSPRRNWKMVQVTSYWPATACGNFWPMRMLQSWRIAAGIARLPDWYPEILGIFQTWHWNEQLSFFSNKKTKRWPLGWMDGVLGAVSLGDKQGCLQQGMAKDSIVREVAKVWIWVLNCPVVDLLLQHRWLEQSGRRGTEGTIA